MAISKQDPQRYVDFCHCYPSFFTSYFSRLVLCLSSLILPTFSIHFTVPMEHPTTREDPAELEKDIQSDSFAVPFPKTEVEHAEGKIILSEAEAYERARAHPEEKKPLYVNFAPNDVDNPRNWTKAKKWYVTCFVCLLNILT